MNSIKLRIPLILIFPYLLIDRQLKATYNLLFCPWGRINTFRLVVYLLQLLFSLLDLTLQQKTSSLLDSLSTNHESHTKAVLIQPTNWSEMDSSAFSWVTDNTFYSNNAKTIQYSLRIDLVVDWQSNKVVLSQHRGIIWCLRLVQNGG